MSILQEDWEIYWKYAQGIKGEYQVENFNEKRIQFLTKLIEEKKPIYSWNFYSNEKAFENIKKEIEILKIK